MMKTRAKDKKKAKKMNLSKNISTFDTTNELKSFASNNEVTKAKLISGEYKFFRKPGRSRIWDTFARIVDGNGKELENVVGCKKCCNVHIYHKTSNTSNLLKHKCYIMACNKSTSNECANVNVDTQIKIDKRRNTNMEVDMEPESIHCPGKDVEAATIKKGIHILTEWTVKNGRPYSILDDSGFKNIAEFLMSVGAKYGHVNIQKLLPHPSTISQNLTKLYEFHFEEVRNEILMFKRFGYSITSDIWSDNNLQTSYLYVTIHYVKAGALVNRLLAVKSLKGVSCDDIQIKGVMKKVLEEFDCDLEKDSPTIVSDAESNKMVVFRGINNIHCVNHLLHKVIGCTLNEVPELMKMIIQCNKIVEYFKESTTNSNIANALKYYCPTRWNTIFYLFKSIETNWNDISNFLAKKHQLYLIQEIDLCNLSSIISLLARFETYSKKLEDNSNPTLHLAIPYITHLRKICRIDTSDVLIVNRCKSLMLELLHSVVVQHFSRFHNIALFLFPPTNKLLQFTETEKDQTLNDCSEVIKVFISDGSTTEQNQDMLSTSRPEENEIFADFCLPYQTNNVYDKINNEIQRYQNVNIAFSEDFNLLQWWNNNKEEFPYLYKTSCKILSIPASSAASESLILTVKKLTCDKRYKFDGSEDMLSKIMFLQSNVEDLKENLLDE